MTKERVRQIQNSALRKIREILERRIWGEAPARLQQTAVPRLRGVRPIDGIKAGTRRPDTRMLVRKESRLFTRVELPLFHAATK